MLNKLIVKRRTLPLLGSKPNRSDKQEQEKYGSDDNNNHYNISYIKQRIQHIQKWIEDIKNVIAKGNTI